MVKTTALEVNGSQKRILRPLTGLEYKACLLGTVAATAMLVMLVQVLTPPAPRIVQVVSGPVQYSITASINTRKEAITTYLANKYKQAPESVRRYVEYAWQEAARHPHVKPELILAVIQKESSLRPGQRSPYGAEGLMQVVRFWHPEKVAETESLMDEKVNIRVGAQILQEYIARYGRLSKALVKYSGDAPGYSDFVIREMETLERI